LGDRDERNRLSKVCRNTLVLQNQHAICDRGNRLTNQCAGEKKEAGTKKGTIKIAWKKTYCDPAKKRNLKGRVAEETPQGKLEKTMELRRKETKRV